MANSDDDKFNQSVPQLFEEQVARYPNQLAIKKQAQSISYSALNQLANRIANAILNILGSAPVQVALVLSPEIEAYAAVMGVSKADKVIVTIDPATSSSAMADIIVDSQAALIITDRQSNAQIKAYHEQGLFGPNCQILSLDQVSHDLPDTNPNLDISPEAILEIRYTSGSTGKPKGIIRTHKSRVHTSNIQAKTYVNCLDRFAGTAPSVGGSIWTFYNAVLQGASVLLYNIKIEGLAGFADWLIKEKITIYQAWPSSYRRLMDALTGSEKFANLRILGLGGETIHLQDIELYKRNFSDQCRLMITYATTETGSVARYEMTRATKLSGPRVPVGHPMPDVEILIFDDKHNPVPDGQTGEIAVRSAYLPPGYWRQPELNKTKFLPDPAGGNKRIYLTGDQGLIRPDGMLEHLGRNDQMIKIRGFRVEVGAIENTLLSLPSVKAVVVLNQVQQTDEHRLVAYVVPSAKSLTVSDLRQALQAKLADYQIPSQFVMLDQLPLLPNGKVDRKALPAPSTARPNLNVTFVAPSTPIENLLSTIWKEVLDLDKIGVHDPFLELGGHSLQALRIATRLSDEFGVQIPMTEFFAAPTITEMGVVILAYLAANVDSNELDVLLDD